MYSIILPIYNQEDHIEILIETYLQALKKLQSSWELLLVINGSHDNSFIKAKNISHNHSAISVYNLKRQGWGAAIKYGISKSKGTYICYTNSARTDVYELMAMLPYAAVNNSCIIRAQRIIRENLKRRIGSILYSLENTLLFNIPIQDVNGTPKIIPRNIWHKLQIISDDTLFDLELTIRCYRQKIPLISFPITKSKRFGGKSTTTFMSALKMYLMALSLKQRL